MAGVQRGEAICRPYNLAKRTTRTTGNNAPQPDVPGIKWWVVYFHFLAPNDNFARVISLAASLSRIWVLGIFDNVSHGLFSFTRRSYSYHTMLLLMLPDALF